MHHGHSLQRHRNRYRFRMRCPKGLVAFDFPGELIVSLRTDSFSLARKRARFLRAAVECLMIDLAGTMNRNEAEGLVRIWVDEGVRQRDLPLPEALLIMGFLEQRFYGRAPDEPLFPELLPQGVGNRQSAPFSSWFTEYRKAIDAYQLLVDFHSFRHNVATDPQNMQGLNLGRADEITGHESDTRAYERSQCAKGVYMRHLKDTLDQIDIGVNHDHLAYDGEFGVPDPQAADDIARFTERAVRGMAVKESRRKKKQQAALVAELAD